MTGVWFYSELTSKIHVGQFWLFWQFVFQTFLHSELENENVFDFLKEAELEQLDQSFENKLGIYSKYT